MQQALLFHRLHGKEDQGFLHVECTLTGALDRDLLEAAWQKTMARHAALRTTVHWENIEKTVQVVHPQVVMPIEHFDWQDIPAEQQKEKLAALKIAERKKGLDLSKKPSGRLALIGVKADEHILLWGCHHILLDGWSAAVVIKDFFAFYEAMTKGQNADLPTLPSYKSVLNLRRQQDRKAAEGFWKKELAGLQSPSLVGSKLMGEQKGESHFAEASFLLSKEETEQLKNFARGNQLTVSSVLQGLWAVLLGRLCGSGDALFGTTVSGRPADLPNVDFMAGMFMNVLPVRMPLDRKTGFAEWLKKRQQAQARARNYEDVSLDEILAWTGWPGHLPLFDCLLVFENFPWEDLSAGGLEVSRFEGGLTTTYPLTVMVKPGGEFEFLLKYDSVQVSGEKVEWVKNEMFKLLNASKMGAVGELLEGIAAPPAEIALQSKGKGTDDHFAKAEKEKKYVAPANATELQLARIWEKILGLHPIGTSENFFEIGGTSLLAVRLFAEIQKQMGRNLPPVTLLHHPTVQALSSALKKDGLDADWDSLVPLQVSGQKPPLFCVHAGGGHVFFYHSLAKHLAPDQPVYAMQPVGLDGIKQHHSSIGEMAAHYIKEIRTVQPEGPIALLGTCLSAAVCHEMAIQLEQKGEEVSLLAMIDSAPEHIEPIAPPTVKDRMKDFMGRLRQGAFGAVTHMLDNRLRQMKETWAFKQQSKQAQNLQKMQAQLSLLYELYDWKPHQSKVTLILCREFAEGPKKKELVTQWERLAKGGLEVLEVPGRHHTLFVEPEVAGLAERLRECLLDGTARTGAACLTVP